jgi:hypothetical protein
VERPGNPAIAGKLIEISDRIRKLYNLDLRPEDKRETAVTVHMADVLAESERLNRERYKDGFFGKPGWWQYRQELELKAIDEEAKSKREAAKANGVESNGSSGDSNANGSVLPLECEPVELDTSDVDGGTEMDVIDESAEPNDYETD